MFSNFLEVLQGPSVAATDDSPAAQQVWQCIALAVRYYFKPLKNARYDYRGTTLPQSMLVLLSSETS